MSIIGSLVSAIQSLCGAGSKKSRAEVEADIAAAGKKRGLDPLHSFVDMQKTFDLDSSPEGREAAWIESGGEGKYERTAAQNQRMVGVVIDDVMKGYMEVPDKG